MQQSIAILQPHLEFGGAERQTVLLANALVKRGDRCTVILHEARGGLLKELSPEVRVVDLGLESHLLTPIVALKLNRELKRLEPSLVIVKLWSSILAASMVDRSSPQHAYNYCEDLDPLDHADYIRFGDLKQRLVGRIFRRRANLSANTNTVAQSMKAHYGLSGEIAVISSAVDPDVVQAKADEHPITFENDKLNVVSVGSLIERKGIVLTLEALRKLEFPVRWHVVGVGPLEGHLRTQSAQQDNVEIVIHGGTPNPYGIMRAADVMVHSAASEAFGIVLLESMAVGTPVIAADSIGPSEMTHVLGLRPEALELYARGDAQALATVIRRQAQSRSTWSIDATSYIQPYVLNHTVERWLERAGSLRAVQK